MDDGSWWKGILAIIGAALVALLFIGWIVSEVMELILPKKKSFLAPVFSLKKLRFLLEVTTDVRQLDTDYHSTGSRNSSILDGVISLNFESVYSSAKLRGIASFCFRGLYLNWKIMQFSECIPEITCNSRNLFPKIHVILGMHS